MPKRYRKRYKKSSMAVRAWKMARTNRKNLQGEKKYIITNGSQQITQTVGNVIYLNACGTGDGVTAREGNYIKPVSMMCRFKLTQTGNDQSAVTRLVIFRKNDDTEHNVTAPSMHDVTTPATDLLEAGTPLSTLDEANKAKYTVLYDELFAGNADGTDNWAWKKYFKMKGSSIHFNDDVGDSGAKGSLYLGLYTDGVLSANNPTLTYYIKIKYIDN